MPLSSPKMKVKKKIAFCQNLTLALDLPSVAEAISLISSISLCLHDLELSHNVIINPLPMCLKKNPETLDGF